MSGGVRVAKVSLKSYIRADDAGVKLTRKRSREVLVHQRSACCTFRLMIHNRTMVGRQTMLRLIQGKLR